MVKNPNIVKNDRYDIKNNNLIDNLNKNNLVTEKQNQVTNENTKVLGEMLSEVNLIKQELDVFGDSSPAKQDDGLMLLGQLLKYLRVSKNFSSLMICRRIKNITLSNNVAEIDFESDSDLSEFLGNEKYKSILEEFFSSKNLSYKVKEIIKTESDIDKLNKLLGGKLIVKHSKNV